MRKYNNTKKLYFTVFLIVLSLSIALIGNLIGYIPIAGCLIAKNKINHYLYDKDVAKYTSYDWYNGNYYVDNITYNLKTNMLSDYDLNRSECISANDIYHKFLNYANELYANQINFPDEIDIWITIDGNNFNKKYMKVYLLGVFDNYSSTKEETIMRMQNIISEFTKFMGSYYQITSMQFDYANLDYAYQLNIDSKRKIIDVSKLHDSFKERDEILNSEFYIRWRKSIA